jgi:hypothetical protein
MFYLLQTPFKSRRDGADVMVTELPIPTVITVGMMRKITPKTSLLFAHDLTELCAGLSPFDGSKLTTPDALAYVTMLEPLLESAAEPGFELPEIKVFKALLQKVSVNPDRPTEFAAQVLQASGMKREDIDAMDYRSFAPAVPLVLELFPGPKS